MKTKSHVRFFSRAAHLDADLELADVFKIAIDEGALSANPGEYIFDNINAQDHPRLAGRVSTPHSRRLVANHLKATLCASFLKDIYEDMTQYFLEILEAAARHGLDPNRLIGRHKVTFEANEILGAGSWPKVVHLISLSVFRRLEGERSTKSLLQNMNDKLGLNVAQATIDASLPYFEIRHLLVHADGKADKKFCDAFPDFGATVGQKIPLDNGILRDARAAIFGLINEFDQTIVANNAVAANELQP